MKVKSLDDFLVKHGLTMDEFNRIVDESRLRHEQELNKEVRYKVISVVSHSVYFYVIDCHKNDETVCECYSKNTANLIAGLLNTYEID